MGANNEKHHSGVVGFEGCQPRRIPLLTEEKSGYYSSPLRVIATTPLALLTIRAATATIGRLRRIIPATVTT